MARGFRLPKEFRERCPNCPEAAQLIINNYLINYGIRVFQKGETNTKSPFLERSLQFRERRIQFREPTDNSTLVIRIFKK